MPAAPAAPIVPARLCIGLYVQLDLGRWEHDLTFSDFKIKGEAQIKALRALGLQRLRYDPARSDSAPQTLQPSEPVLEAPTAS